MRTPPSIRARREGNAPIVALRRLFIIRAERESNAPIVALRSPYYAGRRPATRQRITDPLESHVKTRKRKYAQPTRQRGAHNERNKKRRKNAFFAGMVPTKKALFGI